MTTQTNRRGHWLPFGLLLLFILGCGGVTNQAVGWGLSGGTLVSIQAGGTGSVSMQATRTAGDHGIILSIPTLPSGILATPNPRNFNLSAVNPTQDFDVDIVVNGSVPDGDYRITLIAKDEHSEEITHEITIRVTSNASNTGITKLSDFTLADDGLWVSNFLVDNGAPNALIGSMPFPPFDPGFRVWYRPDSRLMLGVGQSKQFNVVAAIRDTVAAAGTTDFTIEFNKAGTPYGFTSSINVPPFVDRQFQLRTIDGTMRPLLANNDNEAQFEFEFTPDAGFTGSYGVVLTELDPSVMATITPPSVVLDGSGNSVTFNITITRTADDLNHVDDAPYEPVLNGTSSSDARIDVRQRFFIDVVE